MFTRKSSTTSNSSKRVRWSKRLTRIAFINGFKNVGIPTFSLGNKQDGGDENTWARELHTKDKIENSYRLWNKGTIRQELKYSPLDHNLDQLFQSTLDGNLDLMDTVLSQFESDSSTLVNSCDFKGRSLLHLASVCGHAEIVAYLLKRGATVDCWDTDKITTPLICACAIGSVTIIEVLQEHGADVNASSEETGRTALHWAVAGGHLSCVQKLIEFGALERVTQEPDEASPFLLAATFGNQEMLQFFIENGADLTSNLGTTCDSALHLVSILGNFGCTKVLLESGVIPDIRNIYGETPLHLADTEPVVSLLISKGANINATEINGMTPLHFAVLKGNMNLEKIKILISQGADVNAQNDRGETPLFLAANQGTPKRVSYLLSNGANVTIKNIEGVNSYEIMKAKTPHILHTIEESFDRAITIVSKDPSDLDCTISLDFSEIGMEAEKEIKRSRSRNRNSRIVDINSENFEEILKIQQPRNSIVPPQSKTSPNETEFVHRLVLDGHKEILAHPLIESFLALKWEKAKYIFYSNFAFYMLMAVLYTVFTMESFMKSCPYKPPESETMSPYGTRNMVPVPQQSWGWYRFSPNYGESSTINGNSTNPTKVTHQKMMRISCDIAWQIVIVWCLLILFTFAVIMKEISKILHEPRRYLKAFENVGEWIFILAILATSVWGNFIPCKCEFIDKERWHYSTAAVGLVIAWAMILVRIGKFPQLGLYVQMLGKVLKNFGGFLLVYISILNAFALAFCVLFPQEPAFASYPLAMIKVFTMMTGEMGYDDLFYGPYDASLEMRRKLKIQNDELYRACISHLLYCLFVAIVSISLMNLLVALAVSDIQDLQRQAKVERLCKQARSIFSLERFMFSRILSCWMPTPLMLWFRSIILLKPATQRCKFVIRPNDPTDNFLSEELKKAIMVIAMKSFKSQTGQTPLSNSDKVQIEIPNQSSVSAPLELKCSEEIPSISVGEISELKDQLDSLQKQFDLLSKTLVGQMETVVETLHSIRKS